VTVRVKGRRIPRDDGKRIVEYVGAATTGSDGASIARMFAPAGWSEPAQVPDFDETVVVLTGALTVELAGRAEVIRAGEVGFVPRHAQVVYRNEGRAACEYLAICAPAFRPERAHVQGKGNAIILEVGHPSGKAHAQRLEARALQFLGQLGLSRTELSLSIVTDRAIRRLNRTWRKKDKSTDVLSFPAGEMPETGSAKLLGDVVISLDTARRQAREYRRPLEEELDRYLAHGVLHLLGHDHLARAEARKMAALEEALLGRAGMVAQALAERGAA
jgi:probable rRNA maturation factor